MEYHVSQLHVCPTGHISISLPNEVEEAKVETYYKSRHYALFHGNVNKPPIHEGYMVTFVKQPNFHSLNICEDKWYNQLDTQINIQSMILPHVRIIFLFCSCTDR